MSKNIFITGISTDVGKTIASSIVVKALEADYWKPIQSGDLDHTDTMKVKDLTGLAQNHFHAETYRFITPMSPDAAAEKENQLIELSNIIRPVTKNNLVIEGAGGLMVPINSNNIIADLIQQKDYVILVTKHYLGSINHTLLSYNYLKAKGIKNIAICINDEVNFDTEKSLKKHTHAFFLERINPLENLSTNAITQEASILKESLTAFLGLE